MSLLKIKAALKSANIMHIKFGKQKTSRKPLSNGKVKQGNPFKTQWFYNVALLSIAGVQLQNSRP